MTELKSPHSIAGSTGTPEARYAVAGVDGCRGGWVVCIVAPDGEGAPLVVRDVMVLAAFRDVLSATAACRAVAVDMPIGLSETGPRQADALARRLLGPRRSSVFPPPARPVAEQAGDYATLNAFSKSVHAGLSRQTFNILPRIREVDVLITPELQSRVFESHPELCFRSLNGAPMADAKRTAAGQAQRLAGLQTIYGAGLADLKPPHGAAFDDLYDALVLAWTAQRYVRGTAHRVPEAPQHEARGLHMEIVY